MTRTIIGENDKTKIAYLYNQIGKINIYRYLRIEKELKYPECFITRFKQREDYLYNKSSDKFVLSDAQQSYINSHIESINSIIDKYLTKDDDTILKESVSDKCNDLDNVSEEDDNDFSDEEDGNNSVDEENGNNSDYKEDDNDSDYEEDDFADIDSEDIEIKMKAMERSTESESNTNNDGYIQTNISDYLNTEKNSDNDNQINNDDGKIIVKNSDNKDIEKLNVKDFDEKDFDLDNNNDKLENGYARNDQNYESYIAKVCAEKLLLIEKYIRFDIVNKTVYIDNESLKQDGYLLKKINR